MRGGAGGGRSRRSVCSAERHLSPRSPRLERQDIPGAGNVTPSRLGQTGRIPEMLLRYSFLVILCTRNDR